MAKPMKARYSEISRAMGELQRQATLWHAAPREDYRYPGFVEQLGQAAVEYTRSLERVARAERESKRTR